MPSREVGQALGKIFSKMKEPEWIAAQVTNTLISIYVFNPAGEKVKAFLKHHLHHDDGQHLADLHVDSGGHEYIVANGKNYRFDPKTDAWYSA